MVAAGLEWTLLWGRISQVGFFLHIDLAEGNPRISEMSSFLRTCGRYPSSVFFPYFHYEPYL